MTTQQEIHDKFIEVTAKQIEKDASLLVWSASFKDDLKVDSLGVTELVLELEESFDIQVKDEDTEKLRTVGDAIAYICKQKGVPFTPPVAPVAPAPVEPVEGSATDADGGPTAPGGTDDPASPEGGPEPAQALVMDEAAP